MQDWTGNKNSIYKMLGASNHTDKERQTICRYVLIFYELTALKLNDMNKIEKAILNELKEWDLTCSEEPSLKIELAKAIAKVVKKCNIPPVIKSVCDHPWQECESVMGDGVLCRKCNTVIKQTDC